MNKFFETLVWNYQMLDWEVPAMVVGVMMLSM